LYNCKRVVCLALSGAFDLSPSNEYVERDISTFHKLSEGGEKKNSYNLRLNISGEF
jgi:hypothetical protein